MDVVLFLMGLTDSQRIGGCCAEARFLRDRAVAEPGGEVCVLACGVFACGIEPVRERLGLPTSLSGLAGRSAPATQW